MSPHKAYAPRHPAAYPKYLMDQLTLWVSAERREVGRPLEILDPMAGIGRVHDLPDRFGTTVGVELEPEWANQRAGTIVGDATALPWNWSGRFDVIMVSPAYGNRMADHHEAKDSCAACKGVGVDWGPDGCAEAPMLCPDCHSVACECGGIGRAMRAHNLNCPTCRHHVCKGCGGSGLSRRYTYRAALGRPLTENNSGAMQWGEPYRDLHKAAWAEARRVSRAGALLLVNVKNHVRDGAEQYVVEWHAQELARQGFKIGPIVPIPSTGNRDGANGSVRVKCEHLITGRAA